MKPSSYKLSTLSAAQLADLREEISDELERRDDAAELERQEHLRRTVTTARVAEERIRCGTTGCHCARGRLHGPYWYAYLTMGDGRTRKRYVGLAPTAAAALKEAERLARQINRAALSSRRKASPKRASPARRRPS